MISSKYENEKLIVKVLNKVDSSNAMEFEKQLLAIREQYPFGEVILDMDAISYISSAGLRVIMKMKRHESQMCVINASAALYEIFDITGFTQMLEVKRKINTISLEGCPVIGRGETGTVYRYNNEIIVKLFSPDVTLEAIEQEKQLAHSAMLYGIPTAIAYDLVKVGNRYGLVFEMINAETLGSIMKKNPEQLDGLIDKYISFVKEIHSITDDKMEFSDIKEVYTENIDMLKEELSEHEMNKLKSLISSLPEGNSVIHGNLLPGNIMLFNDELVVIDMDEISHGAPIVDLLCLYRDFVVGNEATEEAYELSTGVTKTIAKRIWERFIPGYFDTDSAAGVGAINRTCALGGLLSFALKKLRKSDNVQEKKHIIETIVRQEIIPNAAELIELFENIKI